MDCKWLSGFYWIYESKVEEEHESFDDERILNQRLDFIEYMMTRGWRRIWIKGWRTKSGKRRKRERVLIFFS